MSPMQFSAIDLTNAAGTLSRSASTIEESAFCTYVVATGLNLCEGGLKIKIKKKN